MASTRERHLDLSTLHDKPVVQKDKYSPKPQSPIEEIARKWITEFNDLIRRNDAAAVPVLFQEDGKTVI
jgi:hypothetical protein